MNNEHYYQVENCLLEKMDDDTLLYNPSTTATLHLNASSALVWELCTGENSVQQIIDLLQSSFPEQAEQIAGDVPLALKELLAKGVLALGPE